MGLVHMVRTAKAREGEGRGREEGDGESRNETRPEGPVPADES